MNDAVFERQPDRDRADFGQDLPSTADDFLTQIEAVVSVGAWRLNLDTRCLQCSDGIYQMLGHPRAEPLSLAGWLRYLDDESRGAVESALEESWQTGSLFQLRVALRSRPGELIWAELRCQGRTDEGDASFLSGTLLNISDRLAQQDRVNSAEARLRFWSEMLPDGLLELSPVGRIQAVNQRALTLLGYDDATLLLGVDFSRMLPAMMDEDLHAVSAGRTPLDRVIEGGAETASEIYGIKDRLGRVVWVEMQVRPMRDEQHQVQHFAVLLRDINSRKRLEDEHRREVAVHAETEEIARLGHWRLYLPTDKLSYSAQCAPVIGIEASHVFSRRDFVARIHPDDLPALRQAWTNSKASGEIDIECRLRPEFGERWIRLIGRITRNRSGKAYAASGIVQDITDRRRSEEQLRKISVAIEQSPNAVLITDLHARIEYVNPAFEQLTGYTRDEALGRNPAFLASGLTPLASYRDLWAKLLEGETWQGELINRKKSGETYVEYAFISPGTRPMAGSRTISRSRRM